MNWLLATVLLPLAGIALIWVFGDSSRGPARMIALVTSLVTLLMAAGIVKSYVDHHNAAAVEAAANESIDMSDSFADSGSTAPVDRGVPSFDRPWIHAYGVEVRFSLALDGLSVWLFGLSALLVLTSVLVSWEAIDDRAPTFYALLLLLETGMLGVFAARDVILFYVFFEFTLIPLFFLIGIWGYEDRRYAAIKFFVFTLAGSLFTFLGLLAIVLWNFYHASQGVLDFSFDGVMTALAVDPIPESLQIWIFLALFAGFAVKVPLFPVHTWLPLAHTQAPTAGSVLLAGILLKVGSYGFVRFNLAMLPDASIVCMPWLLGLSAAGIVYGALVALAQSDMKRMIAYSSVSHLGFCMLGVFSLNRLGVQGGVLQMINHGLSTGGLFAIIGMMYERYHTREISDYGGLARRTPILAFFMLVFTFSSIGVPGLNGFSGEFLLLSGAFQRGWAEAPAAWSLAGRVFSVAAVSGVILGAWYMLWLVQRVFFGPLHEPAHEGAHHEVHDLNFREICALVPLVVFVFWIGLVPQHFLQPMANSLDPVADKIAAKIDANDAPENRPLLAREHAGSIVRKEVARVD
ncbi:MAG TPA: NADH-quinone oxidoreductase subunit M [Pirellulales bacterium]|nr:NADH-quinone oxidoreductase subunit M [Pirellulales bacterium]